jgi:hypothetical protein
MPRARFTVRALMIAVAVAALVILAERWRRLAAEYSAAASRFAAAEASESDRLDGLRSVLEATRTDLDRSRAQHEQTDPVGLYEKRVREAAITHYESKEKDLMSELAKSVALRSRYIETRRRYERAARYPWLPVAPDPPEPKLSDKPEL